MRKIKRNSNSFDTMYGDMKSDMKSDRKRTITYTINKAPEGGSSGSVKPPTENGDISIALSIVGASIQQATAIIAEETGHAYRYFNGLVASDPKIPFSYMSRKYDEKSNAYVEGYVANHQKEERLGNHISNIVVGELMSSGKSSFDNLELTTIYQKMPVVNTETVRSGFSLKVVKTKGIAPHEMIVSPVSKEFYLSGGHDIKKEMNRTDLNSVNFFKK